MDDKIAIWNDLIDLIPEYDIDHIIMSEYVNDSIPEKKYKCITFFESITELIAESGVSTLTYNGENIDDNQLCLLKNFVYKRDKDITNIRITPKLSTDNTQIIFEAFTESNVPVEVNITVSMSDALTSSRTFGITIPSGQTYGIGSETFETGPKWGYEVLGISPSDNIYYGFEVTQKDPVPTKPLIDNIVTMQPIISYESQTILFRGYAQYAVESNITIEIEIDNVDIGESQVEFLTISKGDTVSTDSQFNFYDVDPSQFVIIVGMLTPEVDDVYNYTISY